ncbi:MAG: hypothetical protein NVV74_03280 [Magnetospirillum sp.]|nr:hypothetical protein [Magnetospirillum sp.]
MSAKTPQEKLAVLVPHWVEHTHAHIAEMRHWQTEAVAAGPEAARQFAAALDAFVAGADALARVATALPRQKD